MNEFDEAVKKMKQIRELEKQLRSTLIEAEEKPEYKTWTLPDDERLVKGIEHLDAYLETLQKQWTRPQDRKTIHSLMFGQNLNSGRKIVDIPEIKDIKHKWILSDDETRKAMALYFEEFCPEIVEQGFYPDIHDLTTNYARWVE